MKKIVRKIVMMMMMMMMIIHNDDDDDDDDDAVELGISLHQLQDTSDRQRDKHEEKK